MTAVKAAPSLQISLYLRPRSHCTCLVKSRRTTVAHAATSPLSREVAWIPVVSGLAIAGFTGGPLLDGLHSRIPLQVYDVLPFSVAGLNSSLLVPPILASLYVTIGCASIIADKALASYDATSEAVERVNLPYVIGNAACAFLLSANYDTASTLLLAFSSVKENEASGDRTLQNSAESCTRGNHACRILALLTHISAVLHGAEVSTPTIGAILATLAVINWTYFDRTVHGALLGVLLGVGAPLSEVVLNVLFGLWHYPREDLPGMVSWVPWCYAFYVPYLSNLSRYLWQTSGGDSSKDT